MGYDYFFIYSAIPESSFTSCTTTEYSKKILNYDYFLTKLYIVPLENQKKTLRASNFPRHTPKKNRTLQKPFLSPRCSRAHRAARDCARLGLHVKVVAPLHVKV